jgi:hypothetical protein
MEGRTMKSRGDADDILELTELVQWTRNTHQGNNAHKVLLGNCDLRCVPSNMRRMYMQMQIDPRLHNLWLQGCVGVLRAAWACHDAKVADLLQAAAPGAEAEQDGQAEQGEEEEQDSRNSQQEVRKLVAGFCGIVPNRAHNQGADVGTQAQQGGVEGQVAPLAAGGAAEPPVVGGLGQQAEALQEANPSSASASASACHQRVEDTIVAQGGMDREDIMDLMGFSDEEVAALQGDSSEEDSVLEAEEHQSEGGRWAGQALADAVIPDLDDEEAWDAIMNCS